jgi:molybdopterin-guanine dinucleotide biosynthesis protein A
MKILGAVLAGGRSTRFGSDKALASVQGVTLIDQVLRSLQPQCEEVAVVGRVHDQVLSLADQPRGGMGPLGGLAGALRFAAEHGFTHVLSSAVDIPGLPPDLVQQLSPAPSFVVEHPVVGLWNVGEADRLLAMLGHDVRHSMQAFGKACGARGVTLRRPLDNINTREDLRRLAGTRT